MFASAPPWGPTTILARRNVARIFSGETLREAFNNANDFLELRRFKEAKTLLCKVMPVARRVLGKNNDLTLRMMSIYASSLYMNDRATLDDLREAVTTFEEAGRIARRVMGGQNPTTKEIEFDLRNARFALRARETPPPGSA